MNLLQKYLTANAIFSATTGTTLLIFKEKIEGLFAVESSSFFTILGILLLFFSLTILAEIIKKRSKFVLWIIIQDLLWVVGSVVLLIFNPFEISFLGNILVASVAVIVLFLGIGQYMGLLKMNDGKLIGVK